jgi:hypothetical protein
MDRKPSFQELIRSGHEVQLPLPLPPPPRIRADVCRFCHGVHMNVADFIACRESST